MAKLSLKSSTTKPLPPFFRQRLTLQSALLTNPQKYIKNARFDTDKPEKVIPERQCPPKSVFSEKTQTQDVMDAETNTKTRLSSLESKTSRLMMKCVTLAKEAKLVSRNPYAEIARFMKRDRNIAQKMTAPSLATLDSKKDLPGIKRRRGILKKVLEEVKIEGMCSQGTATEGKRPPLERILKENHLFLKYSKNCKPKKKRVRMEKHPAFSYFTRRPEDSCQSLVSEDEGPKTVLLEEDAASVDSCEESLERKPARLALPSPDDTDAAPDGRLSAPSNITSHGFVVISLCLAAASAARRFPDGFKFGAATASYQIEGGWNASDKGESIWDHYVHSDPARIIDLSNGDVACDSYHLWQEDIQLAVNLNLDFYRFSISWSRVLPTGFPNRVSDDGAKYYGALIDGLLARGIEPVVTLFHWDLPQPLQELGGWASPLIADWFEDYARVIFDLYGDRVKTWLTINEPIAVCDLGYYATLAPGIPSLYGSYACSKNILLAHAKAYRLYEKEYKPIYKGKVSIANQVFWLIPDTEEDVELTDLARDMGIGRYSHPIYSAEGGWPPALEAYIAEKSKNEGLYRSRLPAFTKEEIELIRGSYDYYGLNHYTTRTLRAAAPGEDAGVFMFQGVPELGAVTGARPDWPPTASSWFAVRPEGFREVLSYVKQQYGNPEILICENGFADSGSELDDQPRVDFYRDYMAQVLLAMEEDGVKVVGYTAWSLMDNFEWKDGYTSRFGLHHVDFSSPRRARTPRRSARYYAQVARTHDIDAHYDFVDVHERIPTKSGVNVLPSYVLLFSVFFFLNLSDQ